MLDRTRITVVTEGLAIAGFSVGRLLARKGAG